MVNAGCHIKMLPYVIQMRKHIWPPSHPNFILSGWLKILPYLIWMTYRYLNPKSSGWLCSWWYVIWMPYGHCSMSSGWFTILPISPGWHNVIWSLSHPDDLATGSILAVSHPDDLWSMHYVIRLTYNSIVSHPDDKNEFFTQVIRIT